MARFAALLGASYLLFAASDFERGIAAFLRRDFAAAETALRRSLIREPKRTEARLFLSRTLIELDRIPEAIEHLEKAASDAGDAESRFQAGRILQELAARRLADLRRTAPGSAEVHELAGRRLELEGRVAEALAEYRAAVRKEPERAGIHYLIGNLLWRQRELAGAETALRMELTRNPFHGMANLRLGQALLQSDRAEPSVAPLERAVESMPETSPEGMLARRELGKAFRKLGRDPEALAQWEPVAKAQPNDDQVHFLLGSLYRDLGRAEEAQRELRRHREILEKRRLSAAKP
ncbi:MAG: tetratricopeptide repeat protein [Bryobacteraceae bacterium]